jgi:hypothetical protein
MNKLDLFVNLARAHRLHAIIRRAEAELKPIAEAFKAHALEHPGEHVALEDAKSEGTKWVFADKRGRTVVVICPKDKLKGSIGSASKDGVRLAKACGDQLSNLFDLVPSYVPKAKIRDLVAAADLPEKAKGSVLKIITGDSEPAVKWEIRLPEGGVG